MAAVTSPGRALTRALRLDGLSVPVGLGLFKVVIHLLTIHRYGYHRDELYFIACAEHFDLGYVDHAPLVPWITRLFGAPFDYALWAIRLPVVIAGGATVFLTALLARRLGGGGFAQLLAGLAAITAPAYLRMAQMLNIPAFEQLFWTGAAFLLLRLATTPEGRDAAKTWIALGVVAGVGLLNKHTMLIWGAATFGAIVATPTLRRHLRTPWPWVAGALAIAIFSPNLYWQATHEWATYEFVQHSRHGVLSRLPRWLFVAGNVLYMNPLTLPVWGAGLLFLFSRGGQAHRVVGWVFLFSFAILLVTRGKPYYLAAAFPPLFAAGGVFLESRLRTVAGRAGAAGMIAVSGAILSPAGLPLFPIGDVDEVLEATLGAIVPPTDLTHDFHDQHGWPERAEAMEAAIATLPPEERDGALILAANYGEASSARFFGDDLPPVASGHMSWHHWGLPVSEPSVVIVDGFDADTRAQLFTHCEEIGRAHHPEAMHFENHPFYACRGPTRPLRQRWPELERFWHGWNDNERVE